MPSDQPQQSFELSRIRWVGPLTVSASVGAVLLIRMVAVAILHPAATFEPLTLFPPIFDTVLGVAGAVFVFLQIGRYSLQPIHTYRKVALGVLLVSFAPDVALAAEHWLGFGWPEAFALMSMHVAVWAICVTMLPGLVVTKNY